MLKRLLPFLFLFAAQPAMCSLIDILQSQSASWRVMIPAAGAVPGANGEFFRSDINVVNFTDHAQRVRFDWLPQGGTLVSRDIIINAFSGISSEDFVTNVLQQSGLGAILMTGLTTDGELDRNARLVATARIWTPSPNNSSGTTSQTFHAVDMDQTVVSPNLLILGMRRDARYRLNVGIVNPSPNPNTFDIILNGTNDIRETRTVTVPANNLMLVNLAGPPADNAQIVIVNRTTFAATNVWVGFASSVDNATGDSWSEIGFDPPTVAPTSSLSMQ